MPALYPYRIFISHAWSYSDSYNQMIALLDSENNFDYRNYSVPRADPVEANSTARLREKLRHQIGPTQVVIVIAGMYFNHSGWIQYEIDYALYCGKPIIGVRPRGAERTPQAVVDAATEMVNWSTVSIVDAIRRLVR